MFFGRHSGGIHTLCCAVTPQGEVEVEAACFRRPLKYSIVRVVSPHVAGSGTGSINIAVQVASCFPRSRVRARPRLPPFHGTRTELIGARAVVSSTVSASLSISFKFQGTGGAVGPWWTWTKSTLDPDADATECEMYREIERR